LRQIPAVQIQEVEGEEREMRGLALRQVCLERPEARDAAGQLVADLAV
jgi:hypothetical protein